MIPTKIDPLEVLKFNGVLTIYSQQTGEHRTFRIWRNRDDRKINPGKRLVGLLIGPNNTSDYIPFGFVNDKSIAVFKQYRESVYETYARMIDSTDRYAANFDYLLSKRCRRCNQPLSTPRSLATGYGPDCEKYA